MLADINIAPKLALIISDTEPQLNPACKRSDKVY